MGGGGGGEGGREGGREGERERERGERFILPMYVRIIIMHAKKYRQTIKSYTVHFDPIKLDYVGMSQLLEEGNFVNDRLDGASILIRDCDLSKVCVHVCVCVSERQKEAERQYTREKTARLFRTYRAYTHVLAVNTVGATWLPI